MEPAAPRARRSCGTECVSPLTSPNHCGNCDTKCADVANGTVTCDSGACKLACKTGFHACTNTCTVDTDPTACGPSCTACVVPANAHATCAANACAFECTVGYGDCNKDAKDGCEALFASDPLNCGVCGKSCNGGRCELGACIPVEAGVGP